MARSVGYFDHAGVYRLASNYTLPGGNNNCRHRNDATARGSANSGSYHISGCIGFLCRIRFYGGGWCRLAMKNGVIRDRKNISAD